MFNFNRAVCLVTLTSFLAGVTVRESKVVVGVKCPKPWLVVSRPAKPSRCSACLVALTPRLGPTRARRLVEHFGGVQNIFKASLTELEATGIQTDSAQSLGTGQSVELAHDELGRVAAAGVSIVCLDDYTYSAQLQQIHSPP